MDSLFEEYVQAKRIPGATALIAQEGEIVYHKAFGWKDIKEENAQQTTDLFRIASMTKPVTAVAAMMCYEEGKFELDDPLSKFIPEFSDMMILDQVNQQDSTFTAHPAKNPITIRQLFTHTSGIPYGYDDQTLNTLFVKAGLSEGFEERDILLADNVRKIAELPIMHEPGETFTYGLSSDVLGRLIEIWSGQSLDVFFQDRIFDPLEMKDSHFYLPEEKFERLPKVYMSSDSGVVPTNYPLINYPIAGAKRYLSGGADLSCSIYDYYLFCHMLLNEGELKGKRLLTAETVRLMQQTHFEGGDEDVGLGIGILNSKTQSSKARSIGSYSWGGFFATTFWIDPKEELIAILFLQMYPFADWQIQSEFEDIIYRP
ncbi:MAG: serine hydrolase domain-containing protein [Bacteroidota bacterium]